MSPTIARSAACGSLATAKDTVYVYTSGGCSNGSETVGTVNTYNLLSPSLSITPTTCINQCSGRRHRHTYHHGY
ncbi:MAG: hypothetical protein QM756_43390 [Polyangiaceae bacterium]